MLEIFLRFLSICAFPPHFSKERSAKERFLLNFFSFPHRSCGV